MSRYQLICFSLDPALSPKQAGDLVRTVLGIPIEPTPGARLAILPLQQVREAQRRLTRAGVICNYLPAAETGGWSIASEERPLACPHCGVHASVAKRRRNYRCRHCRRPILRHGREVPASRPGDAGPAAKPVQPCLSRTGLIVASALTIAAAIQPRALASQVEAVWHRALVPLVQEFQALSQAAALRRYQSNKAGPMPPLGRSPADLSIRPQPKTAATDSDPVPVTRAIRRPEAEPALPQLPEAVARARTLPQLETALRQQLPPPAKPMPHRPETADFPSARLPLLPASPTISPRSLRAAVTGLDARLQRRAPFLRQLYRNDLIQLQQLDALAAWSQGATANRRSAVSLRCARFPEDLGTATAEDAPVCPVRPVRRYCPLG